MRETKIIMQCLQAAFAQNVFIIDLSGSQLVLDQVIRQIDITDMSFVGVLP